MKAETRINLQAKCPILIKTGTQDRILTQISNIRLDDNSSRNPEFRVCGHREAKMRISVYLSQSQQQSITMYYWDVEQQLDNDQRSAPGSLCPVITPSGQSCLGKHQRRCERGGKETTLCLCRLLTSPQQSYQRNI